MSATGSPDAVNLWTDRDHAQHYLNRRKFIPRRSDAYEVMIELLPERVETALDLGCGDGECMSRVFAARPGLRGVALDFSPEMLERATYRFRRFDAIDVVDHDLAEPLPPTLPAGGFDAIVSGFAIHHLVDDRKRELYGEVYERLAPGGVFVNVEHVDSPTEALHQEFLAEIGTAPDDDDPSNRLVAAETQLEWLREIGFADVDCFWKWRELAVLSGRKPS